MGRDSWETLAVALALLAWIAGHLWTRRMLVGIRRELQRIRRVLEGYR